ITPKQFAAVKRAFARGNRTYKHLVNDFGMSERTLRRIKYARSLVDYERRLKTERRQSVPAYKVTGPAMQPSQAGGTDKVLAILAVLFAITLIVVMAQRLAG